MLNDGDGELTVPPTGDGIRVVIWDLDECFWQGTLDEGAVKPIAKHVAIVRTLTLRGVVSSVCSRSDEAAALAELHRLGYLSDFCFPSCGFDRPKGAALSTILTQLNLSATNALFVDDSAVQRAEARAVLPGLCTMHPSLWSGATPHLWGSASDGGTRLQQYRVLEARRAAERHAAIGDSGDAAEAEEECRRFLACCHVRCCLVPLTSPTDKRLDRIVELLQRANRLNYTRRRRAWWWELLECDTNVLSTLPDAGGGRGGGRGRDGGGAGGRDRGEDRGRDGGGDGGRDGGRAGSEGGGGDGGEGPLPMSRAWTVHVWDQVSSQHITRHPSPITLAPHPSASLKPPPCVGSSLVNMGSAALWRSTKAASATFASLAGSSAYRSG